MRNSALRQPLASVTPLPADITEIKPVASWGFALMLLGLAAVLIATAADYPNLFAVALDHLAEAP
jgi:hypothetical protein